MLSRVLRLCAGTWEGDENSFSANILNGITRLVYTFGNQLNDEVFKERVGALSIKQLVRMSKERCPGSMGYSIQPRSQAILRFTPFRPCDFVSHHL